MDVTATEFIKRAAVTAEHFGFSSIDTLKKHPACKKCDHKLDHSASATDRKIDNLHGMLTAGMQTFCDEKFYSIEEPVFFYSIDQVPRSGDAAVSLHIFNVESSIAEAVLIQATKALTTELGYTNHNVRINSLGDRDSSTRFIRELNNFLRKRIDDLPESARELMKDHAMTALTYLIEKEHELAYRSPSPLEYLTDTSRKHFREIIEFLDMAETAYEIDPKLIGHHECYSDALFAVDILDNETGSPNEHAPLYIRGGRYSEFVHRKTRQLIPAAGAVVVLKEKKAPARNPRTKLSQPSVYVVQLGFGPKIKSLILIDELRQSGINVYQNLASNSLSTQLRDAEAKGVKYVVIIGQKEFVEDAVILRDMKGRNQEQISTKDLITRFKRSPVVATA